MHGTKTSWPQVSPGTFSAFNRCLYVSLNKTQVSNLVPLGPLVYIWERIRGVFKYERARSQRNSIQEYKHIIDCNVVFLSEWVTARKKTHTNNERNVQLQYTMYHHWCSPLLQSVVHTVFNLKMLFQRSTFTMTHVHYGLLINYTILFDFSLTVKAAPHECVVRTGQP